MSPTLLVLLAGCHRPPPPEPPPDVLLVVLDTLRADAVGAYGAARPVSNQLDAVAAAGVLFEDVTAPSTWTWTSHASLFTGLPPWEHGAHHALDGPAGGVTRLREDVPTLAGTFAAAGYDTVSLSANCWLSPSLGLTRGFARAECADDDAEILRRAVAALQEPRERPLLLFVNLLTAHAPYLVQPEVPFSARHAAALAPAAAPAWAAPFLDPDKGVGLHFQRPWPDAPGLTGELAYSFGRFDIPDDGLGMVRDLYGGGVAGVDAGLRDLVTAWNATGRGGGIVAVTSDHGEALGDAHRLGHNAHLGAEVLRVPLAIVHPGRLPAGRRVSTAVSLMSVGDTLADLAGLEGEWDDSLVAVVEGRGVVDPPVAAVWVHPDWAAQDPALPAGRHVVFRDGDLAVVARGDRVSVYDPDQDPHFVRDIVGEHAARVPSWQARAAELVDRRPSVAAAVDDTTAAMLEAIGYLPGEAPPPGPEAPLSPE